jgi:hypothetical protein
MAGVKPDGITLLGVILACTHGGLVDEGKLLFNSITEEFGLKPRIEHYGCMVDLLGRAGLLKEAENLILSMPVEPDAIIWGALLGACSFHGNIELAEIAVDKLMRLEPQNTANLVILSNIYASCGKWDGVAQVWKLHEACRLGKFRRRGRLIFPSPPSLSFFEPPRYGKKLR